MKALPLLLAAFFFAGCDMNKVLSVQEPATPAPTTPKPTPAPKPKPGDWMFKDKGALDRPGQNQNSATPNVPSKATPKPGEWMWKDKGPLDRPARK